MHQKEYGLQACFIIWRDFPTRAEMKIYSCRLLLDLCLLNKCEVTTMFWQGNCLFSIWIWILTQMPMLLPPFLNYCSALVSLWGWHDTLQLAENVFSWWLCSVSHRTQITPVLQNLPHSQSFFWVMLWLTQFGWRLPQIHMISFSLPPSL